MKLRVLAAAVAGAALLTAGCSTGQRAAGPSSDGAVTAASSGGGSTLTVFAAASLKETFTALGTQFEAANPGTKVTFSFAGSSDLAQQIVQGAPADVFAAASDATMKTVSDAGETAAAPTPFATNTLQIAVAPGNPKGIASFKDLTRDGLDVVVCAPQVPCGSATEKIEKATGVELKPVSEDSSVTDVLNKVTTGEADAGVVYVTDVAGAGDKVTGVDFPEAKEAVNTYPIAALKGSANVELAQKFIAYVTGEAGQKVLDQAGFGKP